MSRILVLFCEGSHDVAFLSKIFKTACYKTYHNIKIREYPHPLGGIFEGSLKNIPFGDLKIDEISTKSIPNKILKNNEEEKIVLLYALGGNRQYDKSKQIIDLFLDVTVAIQNNGNEIGLIGQDTQHEISFLFINDADTDLDIEVKKIEKFILDSYGEVLSLTHNNYVAFKNKTKLGTFIFSQNGISGNLEDYLMETMTKNNETIFDAAKSYYENHFDTSRLMRKKVKCQEKEPIEQNDKSQKEYKNKSIINIAGQLQNAGVSQAVTVEYSDYLALDKIKSSQKLQEIITFIENA